jgi:hypothetical protein
LTDSNKGTVLAYPSNNPGKLGKTGEKLGISAAAFTRPAKEEGIIYRAVSCVSTAEGPLFLATTLLLYYTYIYDFQLFPLHTFTHVVY